MVGAEKSDLKSDDFSWFLDPQFLPFALRVFLARGHVFEACSATAKLNQGKKIGRQCDFYSGNVDNSLSFTSASYLSNFVAKDFQTGSIFRQKAAFEKIYL